MVVCPWHKNMIYTSRIVCKDKHTHMYKFVLEYNVCMKESRKKCRVPRATK